MGRVDIVPPYTPKFPQLPLRACDELAPIGQDPLCGEAWILQRAEPELQVNALGDEIDEALRHKDLDAHVRPSPDAKWPKRGMSAYQDQKRNLSPPVKGASGESRPAVREKPPWGSTDGSVRIAGNGAIFVFGTPTGGA
jgi:hypothetical protein